jgi:EspA/EspE family
VLNAFFSTWSNARQTFGEGTPQSGAQYDASGTLNQLQGTVQTAAPGSKWTGGAANAYGAANTEHGRVLGQLAGLDQRLSAHVNESAQVVAAGRRDLDAVRQWVQAAAASTPQNAAGQRIQMAIVQKGLTQVEQIIQHANGELNTIGGKIDGLGSEYRALGNQKFAKEGPQLVEGGKDDEDAEAKRQAERDVHDALAGDRDAAKRVESVLSDINPGQPLSADQGSYLSQMQAQQNGMSVRDLRRAEERLGDQKHIIGDSWQLMSNDDVYFPKTETKVGALDDPSQIGKGSFDQLPESVKGILSKEALASPAVNAGDVTDAKAIAQIVRDGNPSFQTGTEIDREMMRLSDRIMDQPTNMGSQEDVVTDIFGSAGRDHQIVHDHMLGTHGDDGDDFLNDVNNYRWRDDGKAAAGLFSWTNESHVGSESTIAAETAEKYANYVASHHGQLMHMPDGFSHTTLGQANPELVRGYAHGLSPYMADIASLSSANTHDPFDFLDPANPERPNAKGLFSVLSTDQQAYTEFNGAADRLTLEESRQYAEDIRNHVPVSADDKRLLDAAVLKGLVASGSADSAHAMGLNKDDALTWRKLAYTAGVTAASTGAGPLAGPAIESFGGAMESSIIGSPTDPSTPAIPNMGSDESARFVLNALLADGVPVHGIDHPYLIDGHIASLQELRANNIDPPADTGYQDLLNDALNDAVGKENNPAAKIAQKYEDIVKIPDGKK